MGVKWGGGCNCQREDLSNVIDIGIIVESHFRRHSSLKLHTVVYISNTI